MSRTGFRDFCILCLLGLGLTAWAADFGGGWRYDGSGKNAAARPPLEWSAEKNLVWKTKLSSWSNGPVLAVGDKLFINGEPAQLICIDATTGKVLWERANGYEDVFGAEELAVIRASTSSEKIESLKAQIQETRTQLDALNEQFRASEDRTLRGKIRGLRGKLDDLRRELNEADPLTLPSKHDTNGFTSSMPISDGTSVFVNYGTGVVACYSLDGTRKWAKLVKKPTHGWGHSASPVLVDGTLIVHLVDVFGLDAATGATRWQTPSEPGWGTPVAVKIGTTDAVITARKGDFLSIADGKKLFEGKAGLSYATPIVDAGQLFFIENEASAWSLPSDPAQELAPLWNAKIKGSRHYASSLVTADLIYAVSREGWLSVLDRKTGELVYEHELGINEGNTNSVYPSLSLAGEHIFIGFEEGVVLVIQQGRAYQEVARNNLEAFRSTPLFLGERIYLRGLEHLYCIGNPG